MNKHRDCISLWLTQILESMNLWEINKIWRSKPLPLKQTKRFGSLKEVPEGIVKRICRMFPVCVFLFSRGAVFVIYSSCSNLCALSFVESFVYKQHLQTRHAHRGSSNFHISENAHIHTFFCTVYRSRFCHEFVFTSISETLSWWEWRLHHWSTFLG